MFSIDTLFLFLFIFSVLTVLRTVFRFVSALLQNPPTRLVLEGRELIYFGITISYVLTYIIKL